MQPARKQTDQESLNECLANYTVGSKQYEERHRTAVPFVQRQAQLRAELRAAIVEPNQLSVERDEKVMALRQVERATAGEFDAIERSIRARWHLK
jgi:hypothetical protein